jgi:nucleoside-triphosphatase THEP1
VYRQSKFHKQRLAFRVVALATRRRGHLGQTGIATTRCGKLRTPRWHGCGYKRDLVDNVRRIERVSLTVITRAGLNNQATVCAGTSNF